MEKILEDIEENYRNRCIRNFYQEVKKQKQGYQQKPVFIKDKIGHLVTGEQKMDRWAEYFCELLNESEGDLSQEGEVIERREEEDTSIEAPQKEEIIKVLHDLKNSKSPGENGITAELYKQGGDQLQSKIYTMIREVWQLEEMPEGWKEALIYPLHKKGTLTKCENYRGITLLDIAYKIFAICIKNRLQDIIDSKLGEYQAGFRRNRSTIDQIFSLKEIIANSYEHNLPLHIVFIDFKQAYDSIKKQRLYQILKSFNIPEKLIRLILMTLEDTRCKVTVDGKKSKSFKVRRGLRQGDPLAPMLFNLVLEWIVRQSGIHTRGTIYHLKHQCLAFADDLAILARSKKELERIFVNLERVAYEVGLTVNETKTRYMLVEGAPREQGNNLCIKASCGRRYEFQIVDNFVYLGVKISNDNKEDLEIIARLAKGSSCVGSLYKFIRSNQVSRAAKLRVYKTVIRPTVLYGSEVWRMNANTQKRLEVWERSVLRKIYGGKKLGDLVVRKYNKEIMDLYGEPGIVSVVKAQRLKWLGHVTRLTEDRVAKAIMRGGITAKKRRGRPKKRWFDAVQADLKQLGVSDWEKKAQNRAQWRKTVHQAMGLLGLQC